MNTFESFPDLKILSDGEGEIPGNIARNNGPTFLVGMLVFPNGEHPKYSFTNLEGGCHSRGSDKRDHFNPVDDKGKPAPKSYSIKFMIFQTKGSSWKLEIKAPVKFIDANVTSFYSVKDVDDTSFTLTINENNILPSNTEHSFNIYLMETLSDGKVLRRTIDPIVDNPPK